MPITSSQSNDAMEDGLPPFVDPSAEVPAWLAAHRERQAKEVPSTTNSARDQSDTSPVPPPLPRSKRTPKSVVPIIALTDEKNEEQSSPQHWLVRWMSSHSAIGVMISLAVHTVVLTALAFIFFSNVTLHDTINLWGVIGENVEVGSDIVIDTALPNDAGESAPLQMVDMAKNLESLGPGTSVPEMMRVGLGGKGSGEGESGNGTAMGIGSLKIPGHAQTKGSFSAWSEPRDPKPNENYSIVIQMRLPSNVKKFRATDLTGLVTGTDRYRKEISFRSTDQFPVENGVVEIRIPIPGAARLVRDTIRIESKLLREKQTFEIEF